MLPIILSLIQAGLPMIAGAIASKGEQIVKDKLGVDLSSCLGTEEGRLKLKQLELEHEEFLQQLVMETKKLDMADEAMYIQDVGNARNREAQIATSQFAPWINKVATPILAACILLLTFILFYFVVFGTAPIENGRKDVVIYILGILSSICVQVVSYYFGSSKGSAMKDETIHIMQGAQK